MATVYVIDPLERLMPYAIERDAALAAGADFVLGDAGAPRVRDAEVILTYLVPFDAAAIAGLSRCRGIIRCGVGVDSVDLAAATAAGIVVCNAPTYCVPDVADHAASLILAGARRIAWFDGAVRRGAWQAAHDAERGMRRIAAQTIGIIGLGRIGRGVAQRLAPFGARLLGHDPYLGDDQIRAMGVTPLSLEDVLRQSDVVSLHVPLAPATWHLIDAGRLALMKPDATLVNTSRGPLVDTAALVAALHAGRIFGAALDVLEDEPPGAAHPLYAFDPRRVLLTPHAAASSHEAQHDLHRELAASIDALVRGRRPAAIVNREVVARSISPNAR
ncbi:MAG: C-terminal binding protein [Chloroflexi bacterium]|nr:C-terminal binding protein [Chloroflexota bacterium]